MGDRGKIDDSFGRIPRRVNGKPRLSAYVHIRPCLQNWNVNRSDGVLFASLNAPCSVLSRSSDHTISRIETIEREDFCIVSGPKVNVSNVRLLACNRGVVDADAASGTIEFSILSHTRAYNRTRQDFVRLQRVLLQLFGCSRCGIELRVTGNLTPMTGPANTGDYLLIERSLENPLYFRFTLLQSGTAAANDLFLKVTNKRSGPLDPLSPPSKEIELAEAKERQTAKERSRFTIFDEAAVFIETRSQRLARSKVFQRRVAGLYSLKCAVCGDAFAAVDGKTEVEAAHIVPRSKRGADTPATDWRSAVRITGHLIVGFSELTQIRRSIYRNAPQLIQTINACLPFWERPSTCRKTSIGCPMPKLWRGICDMLRKSTNRQFLRLFWIGLPPCHKGKESEHIHQPTLL